MMPMQKNNIVAIVQARLGSTRFPGKVLTSLLGKEVLLHVIERIRASILVNKVVVATTDLSEDQMIVDWCLKNKIECFRGDLHDVLSRFYLCAQKYQATHIVRVTSDNPLADPKVIDLTIKKLLTEKADYAANNLIKSFPHGLDVEFFTMDALTQAHTHAKENYEREHVTQYIRHRPETYKLVNVKNETDVSDIRLTLDEKVDFQLIETVMKLLEGKTSLDRIIKLFEENPALKEINLNAKERHKNYNSSQNII